MMKINTECCRIKPGNYFYVGHNVLRIINAFIYADMTSLYQRKITKEYTKVVTSTV